MAESEQDGALIEAMARALYNHDAEGPIPWDHAIVLQPTTANMYRRLARAALAVARPVIAAETRDKVAAEFDATERRASAAGFTKFADDNAAIAHKIRALPLPEETS